jgi:DNA-binding transcriptional regulator YhcF (GntR family)
LQAPRGKVFSILSTNTQYTSVNSNERKNIRAILIIEDTVLKVYQELRSKSVLKAKSSKKTFVHEIMETDVATVNHQII